MIQEYYISVDVECEGPIPGDYSMIQLGAVFYNPQGEMVEEHCWNIERLQGSKIHPRTRQWFEKMEAQNPGFLKRLYSDPEPPEDVMWEFTNMVCHYNDLFNPYRPVVVCFPATFDFQFVLWYGHHFLGDAFNLDFASCLDLKSYSSATLGINYRDSKKKAFPNRWKSKNFPHTHNALDDAKGQGYNFFHMKEENERQRKIINTIEEFYELKKKV